MKTAMADLCSLSGRFHSIDALNRGHAILKTDPGGRLAQLGEHGVRNAGVEGSNPLPSTKIPARG
jgi:hypothetical protein